MSFFYVASNKKNNRYTLLDNGGCCSGRRQGVLLPLATILLNYTVTKSHLSDSWNKSLFTLLCGAGVYLYNMSAEKKWMVKRTRARFSLPHNYPSEQRSVSLQSQMTTCSYATFGPPPKLLQNQERCCRPGIFRDISNIFSNIC